MAQTLTCGNSINTYVSYFPSLHTVRKDWVLATIKYFLEQIKYETYNASVSDDFVDEYTDRIDVYNEIIKILGTWLDVDTPYYELNYTNIEKSHKYIDIFRKYDLNGLYIFVNHSDNDGYITYNESIEILIFLKKIYKHLDVSYFDNNSVKNKKLNLYNYYGIFNFSFKSREMIKFI